MESMPYITCFKLFVNINVVIMSKWDIDEFCTDPPRPRCFLPKILSQGGGGVVRYSWSLACPSIQPVSFRSEAEAGQDMDRMTQIY